MGIEQVFINGEKLDGVEIAVNGIWSFGTSILLGKMSGKITSKLSKMFHFDVGLNDIENRNIARSVVKKQRKYAMTENRRTKLNARISKITKQYIQNIVRYSLKKNVKAVETKLEGKIYKSALKECFTAYSGAVINCIA